jgi:hypothetical protein
MDIYTTSFCLPRSPAVSTELNTSLVGPVSSFENGDASTGAPVDGATNGAVGQQQQQGKRTVSGSSHQSSQSDGAVALGSSSGIAGGLVDGNDASSRHNASNSVPGVDGSSSPSPADGSVDPTSSSSAPGGSVNPRASLDLSDVMQRVCVDTMAHHQCIVSFSPVDSESNSRNGGADGGVSPNPAATVQAQAQAQGGEQEKPVYNIHLSGGYQQVMAARGHMLRESPFKVR